MTAAAGDRMTAAAAPTGLASAIGCIQPARSLSGACVAGQRRDTEVEQLRRGEPAGVSCCISKLKCKYSNYIPQN
jgi:hypothetical protein